MNAKLIPIAGALVAGLVGVADACYYESSYVCKEHDTYLFTIQLGCWPNVYALGDWIGWSTSYGPGGNPVDSTPLYCTGTGYYTRCDNHQTDYIYGLVDGDPFYRVTNDPCF